MDPCWTVLLQIYPYKLSFPKQDNLSFNINFGVKTAGRTDVVQNTLYFLKNVVLFGFFVAFSTKNKKKLNHLVT